MKKKEVMNNSDMEDNGKHEIEKDYLDMHENVSN
jgi:hypothetical protein